jgi:diguanylate cyclase (GGDEF)-like protein
MYGGEEFIVIMPETDEKECIAAAERLRLAVKALKFDRMNFSLTISGGLTACFKNGNKYKDLLRKADRALYQAKEEGRNRICIA